MGNVSKRSYIQNMETIKGMCENCAFRYKGTVQLIDGVFPSIKCPRCHQETHNFDDEKAVDAQDKYEGRTAYYQESVFEVM